MGRLQEETGGCDVLVNSAGILREAPVGETSLEMWEEVLGVNLTGVFLGVEHWFRTSARASRQPSAE